MSIEYVVGRDYKDNKGRKWKLIYTYGDGEKVFVRERTEPNLVSSRICSLRDYKVDFIVSEWPRTVTLNGEEVELEPWANYVAMDSDGRYTQFENDPVVNEPMYDTNNFNDRFAFIKFKNWKDSLIKL